MDEQLKALVNDGIDAKPYDASGKREVKKEIRLNDPDRGEIEIVTDGDPASVRRHTLKPLAELYGPGSGRDTLDPTDALFTPLLLAIEEVFVTAFTEAPGMTDAAATMALDRLAMSPEANVAGDPLASAIQLRLRMTLSLDDYSRQDVRHALRKVKQSVARHTRMEGPRGYLTFLKKQLQR